jgi:hypothetical protein
MYVCAYGVDLKTFETFAVKGLANSNGEVNAMFRKSPCGVQTIASLEALTDAVYNEHFGVVHRLLGTVTDSSPVVVAKGKDGYTTLMAQGVADKIKCDEAFKWIVNQLDRDAWLAFECNRSGANVTAFVMMIETLNGAAAVYGWAIGEPLYGSVQDYWSLVTQSKS